MIKSLDIVIPFSKRHSNETIRQILRYDSGYLKDLFIKDSRLSFSEECFYEICRLTKGHRDNWKKPTNAVSNIFSQCKSYKSPYLYDFNDDVLISINRQRIAQTSNL